MNKKTNDKNVSQVNTEKLIADLNSKDLRTHVKARLCLLTMGDEAIPCLVQALEDDNREIRWEAAKTLAEMRNPALGPILTAGLENKDPDVRWLSAEGLLALGKEALSPLLSSLIEKPTSTMLLHGAHHILQDFYLKRRHEGEAQYYSLVSISDEIREHLKPVVKALESDEPSHSLPAAAKAALDYLG
jgi:hypothetical protein